MLVRKKNGDVRLCVDYRKLNSVTRKDSYPLPRIDKTLEVLARSACFSSLDLMSGYWQVEMDEVSKEKTAFSSGSGLWQFRVMPFGLCNAPATFKRLMEQVLAGLPLSVCLIYLDDILVPGRNFEEELYKLHQLFDRLQSAGLKLSPKKCHLFQREVKFLRYVVSKDGVATDPAKVQAVQDWPTPTSATETKRFLGLCSYYHHFIRGFTDIAYPLHQCAEKPQLPDCWHLYPDTYICSEAVLNNSTALPERSYWRWRKVSSTFTLTFYGPSFVLRTDHAALRLLFSFRLPAGQIARWLEHLQQYDFRIEHQPGRNHGNADDGKQGEKPERSRERQQ